MAQKESTLSRKIVKALNALPDTWARKIHMGIHQRGIPDIIGCSRSIFISVETKMPGRAKDVTEHQAATMEMIQDAGGVAVVATSVTEAVERVEEAVEEVLDEHR